MGESEDHRGTTFQKSDGWRVFERIEKETPTAKGEAGGKKPSQKGGSMSAGDRLESAKNARGRKARFAANFS